MLNGYKTYFVGGVLIIFGISGLGVDLIDGKIPQFEIYGQRILEGLGLIFLRMGIKKIG